MVVRGRIISFNSCSGYRCKGILYETETPLGTVIHIHGSYGNFYDNGFIQTLASYYNQIHLNLLAFNLETHGVVSDGFKEDRYGYFGGAISSYETSVDDIAGAIEYAKQFGNMILLQGHSQGTDKILNFLWKTGTMYPAILLSPCDSYKLQELWIAPERVETQIARIRNSPFDGTEWLPLKEFGIKSGCENYYIPITKAAFLALADGFNFHGIRYEEESIDFFIQDAVFIYLGGEDPFQTCHWKNVETFFLKHISSPSFHFYCNGNHDMDGIVDIVANDIVKWINGL